MRDDRDLFSDEKSFIEDDQTVRVWKERPPLKPVVDPSDKKNYKPTEISEEEVKFMLLEAAEPLCGSITTPSGLIPSGNGGYVCHLVLKNLAKSFDKFAGGRQVFHNYEIPAGSTVESIRKNLLMKTKLSQMES